ncbi:FAD-binding domain-containing protein [Synechococcus sp. CBW1006]|uniref:FAD-binding domain-containing protein n=1 Tax=Synechococcus sp. CBW1006 TaxID=1353138 RepID=UPI0018CF58F5|nr:deoxyribodipyrimidine photolyase [Synechococcus sp. CBW1006]
MDARAPHATAIAHGDLPRKFASRAALVQALRPLLLSPASGLSPIRGGRAAAERRLAAIDPGAYGRSRNALDGAVTRLSPYIRHGVLTLAEVRDAVFAWLETSGAPRAAAAKLIAELGWRDYWQRLWHQLGDGIWHDREPLKTGHPAPSYAAVLPADIQDGSTGLTCIDAFAAELIGSGWLHNHARLWLASYVVHWRRVRWQAGAQWFLQHLLDGDPASNALSWQWVASSFSTKPYIFNRANLERYGGQSLCARCPAARRGGPDAPGGCPFDADYEQLQQQLFPWATEAPPASAPAPQTPSPPPPAPEPSTASAFGLAVSAGPLAPTGTSRPNPDPPQRPVLWIHGEALGPANPALRAYPGRPALFVFDSAWLTGTTTSGPPPSLKRLGFLAECLVELPVTIRHGDPAAELLAFAQRHGADGIVTSAAVDPRLAAIQAQLAGALPLTVLPPEPFVVLEQAVDLGRFSRYWRRAEARVWAAAGRGRP